MKKLQWLLYSFAVATPALAQDFAGYRTGNYTGVNSVFFNPANIADSRYRWDVNLVSISTLVGNNKASFNLKDLGNSFKGDTLKNQIFGSNAGPSSGTFGLNVIGPSVMFNINKKTSVAITTRARTMVTISDIDGKLANKLINDFENDPSLPYQINSNNNMHVTANAWTEFGASVARVLVDKGTHFLKGGVSLKYLAGAANGYLYINQLKTTLNADVLAQDVYLSPATGRLGMGFGGVKLDDFSASDLTSFKSTGFGADIGFVYEFRPGCEAGSKGRHENKYKLRVGAALLDLGSIKYTRDQKRSGAYDLAISSSESFYFSQLQNANIDNYKSVFNSRPDLFTSVGDSSSTYKVSLPTTLQLDADYHIHRGFYVNVAGQISMVRTDTKPYNSQYYNAFTVTPRFEGKTVGVYVPINYNELTKMNAGISFRFGPLFLGSGSALTALFGNSKQADFYFGLRFGGLQRKK